jgi:MinD superfamily P-loop ATPase
MKQLLILSGKGGTGKTTAAGAFIEFGRARAFADCDVDAPNLHLIAPQLPGPEKTDFWGLPKAVIDSAKCAGCGLCEKHCRFDAIENFQVNPFACEGCGVCVKLCPEGAIVMEANCSGSLMLYRNERTVFSTAQLNMGSGASGKLVTAVRQQLAAQAPDADLAVIDGSPGIGCPVIASISGVDLVLIVAEPTLSGIHDMERIIAAVEHFGASCVVCINKYDINPDLTRQVELRCDKLHIPVIGRIPYDETVIRALNQCQSIACYPESPAGAALASLWERVVQLLDGQEIRKNG